MGDEVQYADAGAAQSFARSRPHRHRRSLADLHRADSSAVVATPRLGGCAGCGQRIPGQRRASACWPGGPSVAGDVQGDCPYRGFFAVAVQIRTWRAENRNKTKRATNTTTKSTKTNTAKQTKKTKNAKNTKNEKNANGAKKAKTTTKTTKTKTKKHKTKQTNNTKGTRVSKSGC